MFMMISFRGLLLLLLSREFFIFKSRICIYFTVRRGGDFWAKKLSEVKAPSQVGLGAVRGSLYRSERSRAMGATDIVLSMQEGAIYDPGESLSPRLGFRERVSGSVFASRFHFFGSIILSVAEISSKVGAFHRRTAQPPEKKGVKPRPF